MWQQRTSQRVSTTLILTWCAVPVNALCGLDTAKARKKVARYCKALLYLFTSFVLCLCTDRLLPCGCSLLWTASRTSLR